MKRIVTLIGGRYYLERECDGAGDSGGMLESIDPATGKQKGENGDIIMGCCIKCGSPYGRSFSTQDWWRTSPITEILEVSKNKSTVKFKTGSSIYTVGSF